MEEKKYSCSICSVVCSGIDPYLQHMQSVKHEKKVDQEKLKKDKVSSDGIYYCEICGITCSGIIPFQQHLKSEKHSKKERSKVLNEKYGYLSPSMQDHQKFETDNSVSVSSASDVKENENHCASPEMVNEIGSTALAAQNSLQCSICDKKFNGPIPYGHHINSFIHEKNVKKYTNSEKCPTIFTSESNRNLAEVHLPPVEIPVSKCDINEKSTSKDCNSDMPRAAHGSATIFPVVTQNANSCELCNKSFTGVVPYLAHMNGTGHKKNVKKARMSGEEMVQTAINVSSSENVAQNIKSQSFGQFPVGECYICKIKFYNKEEILEHYESESHNDKQNISDFERKVKVFKPDDPFNLAD